MWLELLNLNVLPCLCHIRDTSMEVLYGATEQRNFFKFDEMTRAGGDCLRNMSLRNILRKISKNKCIVAAHPANRLFSKRFHFEKKLPEMRASGTPERTTHRAIQKIRVAPATILKINARWCTEGQCFGFFWPRIFGRIIPYTFWILYRIIRHNCA